RLRREPRREGLATLEAAALALALLEGRPEIEERMLAGFARLLERYRRRRGAGPRPAAPRPHPGGARGRRGRRPAAPPRGGRAAVRPGGGHARWRRCGCRASPSTACLPW